MQSMWRVAVGLLLNLSVVATVGADDELKALLDRVMAHDIKPAAGFTAKVIVPPGQLAGVFRERTRADFSQSVAQHRPAGTDSRSRRLFCQRPGEMYLSVL
jgi:hypothetical protein